MNLRSLLAAVLLCSAMGAAAQDIDSNVTSRNRSQASIADQIRDPAERAAFISLYEKPAPAQMLAGAEAFIAKYPESAFLAQAYEIAAQGSFATGNYKQGLDYAQRSLALLPENPLLLVAVADVQAGQHENDDAIRNGTDALRYFELFAHPVSVTEGNWPTVKRQQQGIAYFAIGRAQLQKALKQSPGDARRELLRASVASLSKASESTPDDQEVTYLLGIAHLSVGELSQAASEFAAVYASNGEYAPRALESLQGIYQAQTTSGGESFREFLADAGKPKAPSTRTAAAPVEAHGGKLPEYAGSHACKECHAEIYQNWSESGMAKMFRPYQPQNVIGDFAKANEFYTGDDVQYLHGKLNVLPGSERKLFSRMVVRSGKHYFDIQQADGKWHSYPVDYTIGSKWQQAYATKLPNGQIHVFPIQYSVLEKKWLNYWKSLDGAGSERSDPYNFERLDSSTNYQEKCAVCHTSQLRNTKGGGLAADGLEFREPGIGCEMCHGPSAGHIAGMANGVGYSKKAAIDPPVDFQQITSQQFLSICAQCHQQATLRDPGPHGELNYSPTGKFYQENLSVPFGEFTRKGFYKDGRFSQTTFIVEALERSKCFRQGQVTCGSCHDPHSHDFSTNQTSLRFKSEPDKMCTSCHSQFQDKLRAAAHTHHAGDSEGSRCVACHMPRIMDALTFSARTHQIDDIPNAEMTLRFGQQESPNACLMCHKEKSAQWVQAQLQSWNAKAVNGATVAMKIP